MVSMGHGMVLMDSVANCEWPSTFSGGSHQPPNNCTLVQHQSPPPSCSTQAAGRLRQLTRGLQFVRFVGGADVSARIAHASALPPAAVAQGGVRASHVMRWVMDNTVEETQRGVLEWVAQVRGLVHWLCWLVLPLRTLQLPLVAICRERSC